MKRALLSMLLAAAIIFGSAPVVGAASDDGGPTRPDLWRASSHDGLVYVEWNASSDPQGVEGYNIYRNNRYVTSVSGTRFVDSGGDVGDRYFVVAYDRSSPAKFSDPSRVRTSGNYGSSAPQDDAANSDRPTTPSLAPWYSNWRRGQNSPHALFFILWWEASTDHQGIAGYNIYLNDQYWKTVGANERSDLAWLRFSPDEVQAGDSLSVVAFDYHANRAYSDRSQDLEVPPIPDVVHPPGR